MFSTIHSPLLILTRRTFLSIRHYHRQRKHSALVQVVKTNERTNKRKENCVFRATRGLIEDISIGTDEKNDTETSVSRIGLMEHFSETNAKQYPLHRPFPDIGTKDSSTFFHRRINLFTFDMKRDGKFSRSNSRRFFFFTLQLSRAQRVFGLDRYGRKRAFRSEHPLFTAKREFQEETFSSFGIALDRCDRNNGRVVRNNRLAS